MEYELSWYEKIDDKWVRQCRPVSEYEYEQIRRTNKVLGFKKGSLVYHVQLVSIPEPLKPYNPELKQNKHKLNKPYYRKERW